MELIRSMKAAMKVFLVMVVVMVLCTACVEGDVEFNLRFKELKINGTVVTKESLSDIESFKEGFRVSKSGDAIYLDEFGVTIGEVSIKVLEHLESPQEYQAVIITEDEMVEFSIGGELITIDGDDEQDYQVFFWCCGDQFGSEKGAFLHGRACRAEE